MAADSIRIAAKRSSASASRTEPTASPSPGLASSPGEGGTPLRKGPVDEVSTGQGSALRSAFAKTVPAPAPTAPIAGAKTFSVTALQLSAAAGRSFSADGAARSGAENARGLTSSAAAIDRPPAIELAALQRRYDAAKEQLEQVNERLSRELANFGPALTDAQKRDYIEKFKGRPEYAAAVKAEAEAAQALREHLSAPANREALQAAMKDPATAAMTIPALYSALQSLATVDGELALDYAKAIGEDPELARLFNELGDFEEDVVGPAAASAATSLLAQYPDDPARAAAELRARLEPLKSIGEGRDGIDKALNFMQAAAHNDVAAVDRMLAEWRGKGGLLKGITIATLAFGAAAAVDDVSQRKFLEATKNVAQVGEQGLPLLVGALKVLTHELRLAQLAPRVAAFGNVVERLAPALGLLANSASFIANLRKADENGRNWGYTVAAFGDAVAVIGGALAFVPGGQPASALLVGIGATLSAAGSLAGDALDDARLQGARRQTLIAVGIGSPLLEQLLGASGAQVRDWQRLGVTVAQMQQLVARSPNVLRGGDLPLGALLELQQRTGMQGTQLFDLLMASDSGTNGGIVWLLRAVGAPPITHVSTPGELLGAFRRLAADEVAAPNAEAREAFQRAAVWIATNYDVGT